MELRFSLLSLLGCKHQEGCRGHFSLAQPLPFLPLSSPSALWGKMDTPVLTTMQEKQRGRKETQLEGGRTGVTQSHRTDNQWENIDESCDLMLEASMQADKYTQRPSRRWYLESSRLPRGCGPRGGPVKASREGHLTLRASTAPSSKPAKADVSSGKRSTG